MIVDFEMENTEREQIGMSDSSGQGTVGVWRAFQKSLDWRSVARHFGIDRAIAYTILARGWASCAGLVTVVLIVHFLSAAEQGYYYTFGSLIALQIVFELGFSFVILQMASHERAHLSISADQKIVGDPVAHARLASVFQKTLRWYSTGACLVAVFLLAVGSHFFALRHDEIPWRPAWYTACIAAAFTFQIDPLLSFMEGCGFVSDIARVRFKQAAFGSIVAWAALLAHHGLFAPGLIIAGNALVALIWLFRYRHLLLSLLRHRPGEHAIHWMAEVWHFQWRIAISWLCSYFIFQLYNPVLFAYWGPAAAGQMGMSLTIGNAITSVAISWISTKSAPFGNMIARKDYAQLDRTFFPAMRQALIVSLVCAVVVWAGVVYVNWKHNPVSSRVLNPMCMGLLLSNTVLNIAVSAEALYLRAHKQEKFLLITLIGAALVACSTYFLGKTYGALGMVSGSLAVCVFVGLPLGTYTLQKYRRIWHAH